MNISAQCALKLTLMFTVPESREICEHKSELECTLSTDIHNSSYHISLLPIIRYTVLYITGIRYKIFIYLGFSSAEIYSNV